jgi:transcriptional regulator GlxA family with amidase domain
MTSTVTSNGSDGSSETSRALVARSIEYLLVSQTFKQRTRRVRRIFKQHVGKSPTEYRESLPKGA